MSQVMACLGLLLMSVMPAFAGTYYVSTSGSTAGNGSLKAPWPSVEYALGRVHGGNTIVMMPGDYQPFRVPESAAGTAAAPTVIKSQTKWKARIRSFGQYGVVTDSRAPHVVLDGLEVTGASMVGIYLQANDDVIRNCWIHNNSNQGIGAYDLRGTVIDSNLIEFNGQFPHFHHGIYADGDRLTISNNIIRYNTGFGMQLYPSITNSRVYNNVVTDQPSESGILVACPDGGGKNVIANNTVCGNGGYGIRIWNGNGEVVANNIVTGNKEGQIPGNDRYVHTVDTVVVNNLTTGDPGFVDATKGVYWLKSDSPARGKGTTKFRPATNFWGLASRGPVDLGAYPYVASLTDPAVRADWPNGYAFCRRWDTPGMELPDLWAKP
jgi:serralysin